MTWQRASSIFLFILLGALTTGVGMGMVVFHARGERDTLQARIRADETRIESLLAEHTKMIDEASKQVTKAEEARKSTQAHLDTLTLSQGAWDTARALPSPDARTLRSWKNSLSLGLGVSVHVPTISAVVANDQSLTGTINGNATTAGDLWFSLTRYTPEAEASLRNQLTVTSSVSYRLGTRLVRGSRGLFRQNQSPAFVVRIEEQGVPRYLVWIRTIKPLTEPRLLEILSTLTFAS